jgi:mono/diheme cytochrome c family protein
LIVVLLSIPEIIPLDSRPHASWLQFIGRFHPLAVHLPIGFIVLLPLLEIAGLFRPAFRETAGFVLGLACAASLGAAVLGLMLAYGSGDTGAIVVRHMWGAMALSIGMLLCLLARPSWSAGVVPRLYPALLVVVLCALLYTAHQGGSITYGANYLTQYMPAPLKRLSALNGTNMAMPNPDSFYVKRIHPIFDANCLACHGAGKIQGGLRLDTYDFVMKGGKDGAVIAPHNSENSMLIERITLPASNQHFMPAEGRPPLKPEEIALIRAWIQQGASASAISVAGVSPLEPQKDIPFQPVGDYSQLMGDIRKMQQSQGAKLIPLSNKPSDGLILNTVDVASNFNDTQLAQLMKFAPYIVDAELGRTAVTDASFDTLSKFSHLRELHLEGTSVTGSGLSKLVSLSQLTYLNLSETKITASALASVKSMPNLRHIYYFDTPAQPEPPTDAAHSNSRSAQ